MDTAVSPNGFNRFHSTNINWHFKLTHYPIFQGIALQENSITLQFKPNLLHYV